MEIEEFAYKICIFGESGVGKTTLTRRYLTGNFELDLKITMGVQIFVKFIKIENISVILQIWDFGGEEDFRFLLPGYARGSSGGIIMYDITSSASLERLDEWLAIFKEGLSEEEKLIPILMVGGKLDLHENRDVSSEEAVDLSKSHNLFSHIECSSKTGQNVELIFKTVVNDILKNAGLI